MKNMIFGYATCCLISIGVLMPSCVSKKKYNRLSIRSEKLQTDSAVTHKRLEQCNISMASLERDKASLQDENAAVMKELKNLSATSTLTIADQARRLKNLQDLIQSQRNVLTNLKTSLGEALINFKADEISVNIKDGNVYVSLEEKLLFKSGKADVDAKGKQALSKLAEVLRATPDINIVVEGHTDNVPISQPKFQDNWALSVARATEIVRILTKEYKVDPKRITAAGRGEYYPVRSNDTDAGKASNRRTEIIISPDLKEMFKLLEQ
ncbi:MAG TPA: OmpA family protein [Flavobacteriales bacterium]|nr:OmpA family protein [Flavobacteriales bacterium]